MLTSHLARDGAASPGLGADAPVAGRRPVKSYRHDAHSRGPAASPPPADFGSAAPFGGVSMEGGKVSYDMWAPGAPHPHSVPAASAGSSALSHGHGDAVYVASRAAAPASMAGPLSAPSLSGPAVGGGMGAVGRAIARTPSPAEAMHGLSLHHGAAAYESPEVMAHMYAPPAGRSHSHPVGHMGHHVPTHGGHMRAHGGHSMSTGSLATMAEDPATWQARIEAKVDRMTSELLQVKHLLLAAGLGGAHIALGEGIRSSLSLGVPPTMPMSHGGHGHPVGRRGGRQGVPGGGRGGGAVSGPAGASGGHSTSDKIDARRRRYPGFRGVPICACCNKAFCLIFNSPGGKCKRGEQCEHAHHYMPPNAPTGSIVHPLPMSAPFK